MHHTSVFKYSIVAGILFFATNVNAAPVDITGGAHAAIRIEPERNTGLNDIFVIYDLSGITVSYKSETNASVRWLRYSSMGGGYAEEVPSRTDGNVSILENPEGDMGYIVEDGDSRYYFWIVDYSRHKFSIHGLEYPAEQDCDRTALIAAGTGDAIHYYTINGQQRELSREIEISYNSQLWNEDSKTFDMETVTTLVADIAKTIYLTPPAYCSTYYNVSGDRFLKSWGLEEHYESGIFPVHSVDVRTYAEQSDASTDEDEASNVIKGGNDSELGGSAPAEITFCAETTEGVIHNEWQLTSDPEFENIDYRFNDKTLTYTFDQEGTFYLRFIGSNADGSCESIGDTYTVGIGASELKCPNAFSPDGDGVNDLWKVAYKSLTEFKCWIFDRYGKKIFEFDRPEMGWDGKSNGKLVKPGVYYYVIQAKGADGKKYKKSGDINILRRKTYDNSQQPME